MKHFALTLVALLAVAVSSPTEASAARATTSLPHTLASATSRPVREVFGFALGSSLSDPTVGYPSWNFSLLTTVAYFGLHVNDDGTFAGDSDNTIWNSSALTNLVSTAHAHGTKVVLTIILQDFSAGTPHMCAGLAHASTTVTNTVDQVKAKGVDGINIDYEGLNGACGTSDSSWARHTFTNFAGSLRASMPAGSYLSVDTYASSANDSLGFFDVKGLATHVDSFFVMAYDLEYSNYTHYPLGCSSFCLGPTAPVSNYYYTDTSTASQYMNAVGAGKVILGVPYYGRKACVGSATPNAYPTSAVVADSYLDASGEATSSLVKPGSYATHRDTHDGAGQERWDTWFNTSMNCTRELYWDDVTSLGDKYDLVNHDGLRGVGIWNLNYGGGAPELWSALALHFALIPGVPGTVLACMGGGSALVTWSPASSADGPITSYVVTANPGGATVTVPANVTLATIGGLTFGTVYTFTVQAVNGSGAGVASTSGSYTPTASTVATSYFSWFDRSSPGMSADNIHLFNPGATPSSGCLALTGKTVLPFSLNAGQEKYLSFPAGSMGGPVVVTVNSGPAVEASQRVQYYSSFNEVWAMSPAEAATTSYLSWYDRASPGMVADNIHVLNPGTSTATGSVSLAGSSPVAFTLAPGQETYVSFGAGKIGGPVKISADQPVLASQRVQYYHSFNEVVARNAAQASATSYLNWFDRATPGMLADNIHILNPGTSTATGTVSLAGANPISFSLGAGQETYVSFGAGKIGGPVKITASQPLLASQRVQYYQSFNEVPAEGGGQAQASSHLMWFDRATPGMLADNIHLLNPGSTTVTVTVGLPGANPITLSLAAGQESYVSFGAGKIGGPVTISASGGAVLAAQRVQYYQTFNEVPAA